MKWSMFAAALAVAAVGWFIAVDFVNGPFDDESFDRTIWIQMSGNVDDDNPRGLMVDSLIEKLEERHPTRDEVIQLLGPSESDCGPLSPPVGPGKKCVSYELGAWSGFRMDPDTLDIYFGDDGRFMRAVPVQH